MKLRYKIANGILILFGVAIASLAIVISHTSTCESVPALSSDTETMKAIVYRCYGPPDVIEFSDIEKPVPAVDEVLVKVVAASVNPLDWHFVRGTPYFLRLMAGLGAPDFTGLGVDFAGTVESVGSAVTTFRPGDEVFGAANGAFAEYVIASEGWGFTKIPTDVTFEQVAALPVAAVTALQALRDTGKLEPGQSVLINGASGGVGTFAVQIAKSFGAEVTGVCSARNAEMVRSLGADYVLDYRASNYTESDKQYDLIVDMIGNHSLLANKRALKPDGTFVIVGGGKGNWLGPMITPIKALLLSPFVDQEFVMILAESRTEDLLMLANMMQAGELTAVIDRHYPLSEVRAALEYSEQGHARGKIIIDVQ